MNGSGRRETSKKESKVKSLTRKPGVLGTRSRLGFIVRATRPQSSGFARNDERRREEKQIPRCARDDSRREGNDGGEGARGELSNDWAHWYGWDVDSQAPSFQNAKTGNFERKTPETVWHRNPASWNKQS